MYIHKTNSSPPRIWQKLEDKGRLFNAISQEVMEQRGALDTAQGCPTLLHRN